MNCIMRKIVLRQLQYKIQYYAFYNHFYLAALGSFT